MKKLTLLLSTSFLTIKKLALFSIFYLTLLTTSVGQNGDCIKAREVCSKDSLIITFSNGDDFTEVTRSNASCLSPISDIDPTIYESGASCWLKWRVKKTGTLTFIITPDARFEDIDFVVYKLTDKTCGNLQRERCMGSSAATTCSLLGATGLKVGETDIAELGGCSPTDASWNNFLAPLNVQEGEVYVLFMQIYTFTTQASKGKITFGGTAEIGCGTSGLSSSEMVSTLRVYPNPVQSELFLEATENIDKILIVNTLGQIAKTEKGVNIQKLNPSISVSDLPKGYYTVQCQTQVGKFYCQKFIKN
jgi:hypothetical protein